MKPLDLSEMIKGLMVVIGIAVLMGKLPELKHWAARKARITFSMSELRAGAVLWILKEALSKLGPEGVFRAFAHSVRDQNRACQAPFVGPR